MPEVETNGIVTFYEDTGDGPTVVLIHGHSLDLRMWKYQVAPLVDMGYRVLRYDVRGHGRSTVPASGYTGDNYSRDLAELLRAREVASAHVVGLSMGGGIALKFALDHPTRAVSLTLVDSILPGFAYSEEFSASVVELREAVRSDGAQAALGRLWLPHALFDGLRKHPEQFAEAAEMVAVFQATEYLQEGAEPGYVQPDLPSRLGDVKPSTLVVLGEDDLLDFRLIADLMEANIPGARKVIIENAGHVPPMEKPEAFNRVLMEFLAPFRKM